MDEIRVEKILPEHTGWKIYLYENWELITAVGKFTFLFLPCDGGESSDGLKNSNGWLVRPPQPASKLPSDRLQECWAEIQSGKGPYTFNKTLTCILNEHHTAIQQLKEKREGYGK